jgi:non-ribosomal peptide synthetase component E (peptide arylation enzyme)
MKAYPFGQRTLPAVLVDKAAAHHDAPFLLGDEPLSYAGLLDTAQRLAAELARLGVQRASPC